MPVNNLQHGANSRTLAGGTDAQEMYRSGELERIDYRLPLPPVAKPFTNANTAAREYRRSRLFALVARYGESVATIEERVIQRGKNAGKRYLAMVVHPPFDELLWAATVQYRAAYIAGLVAGKPENLRPEQHLAWRDKETRWAVRATKLSEQMGIRPMAESDVWAGLENQPADTGAADTPSAVPSDASYVKGDS